jgi:hypothetical protein
MLKLIKCLLLVYTEVFTFLNVFKTPYQIFYICVVAVEGRVSILEEQHRKVNIMCC